MKATDFAPHLEGLYLGEAFEALPPNFSTLPRGRTVQEGDLVELRLPEGTLFWVEVPSSLVGTRLSKTTKSFARLTA